MNVRNDKSFKPTPGAYESRKCMIVFQAGQRTKRKRVVCHLHNCATSEIATKIRAQLVKMQEDIAELLKLVQNIQSTVSVLEQASVPKGKTEVEGERSAETCRMLETKVFSLVNKKAWVDGQIIPWFLSILCLNALSFSLTTHTHTHTHTHTRKAKERQL